MRIGYAVCGSFCTHEKSIEVLKRLTEKFKGAEIIPILSENTSSTDTKFGRAEEFREKISAVTSAHFVSSIPQAEVFGPTLPLDLLIISPCTGNTLAKLALGITDTTVTMAAKAHLRSDRPCLIALASNDALSANLKNISTLLSRKNVYFVPMIQDSPEKKPHSLIADFELVCECAQLALSSKQLRPLFR